MWPSVLVLAAAVGLCYANGLGGPFLFDDTQPTGELSLAPEHLRQLRPITRLSLALNHAISGTDTWSYHLFNVLVHLAAGLVLLLFLRRTIRACAPALPARTRAGLALAMAALWVVHPLQTAAVTYISQRTEALASLFYLTFLHAYLRAVEDEVRLRWQLLALLALALGLATKEIVATAPVLAWLLHATILAPAGARGARATWKFQLALVLEWGVLLALFVARLLFASETTAGFGTSGVTPLEYARSQPAVVLHYLRLAFWPHPLCLDYGWPVAVGVGAFLPQALAILVLLVGTGFGLLKRSWLGFAGAWFFVILAPTSSFVPIQDLAFEHRMYLPLAAVVGVCVVAAWQLCRRVPRARWLPPALAAVVAASLATVTVRRNRDYGDEIAIWQSVVACRPDNPRAYQNLSAPLIRAGRTDEAVAALEAALRLQPSSGLAHNNLAAIHMNAGRLDEAVALLTKAIVQEPSYALTYHNLGNCYLRKGELDRAIFYYQRALERFGAPYTYRDLGIVHANKGELDQAEAHFRRALELDPQDEAARKGLEHVRRRRAERTPPRGG